MLCFVFAALVVLLDQFFKRWIVRSLELFESMELIPGVIGLTHIQNTGAAFSILADQRWLLAGISFVASIILVFILLRYTEGFWGTLGLSAVLGGAVGNLIDRVFHGYVVDMFRFEFINFAIFNIADIFITLGFATFCIHFIVASIRTAKNEKKGLNTITSIQGGQGEVFDFPEELGEPDFGDFSDTRVIPTGPLPQIREQHTERLGTGPLPHIRERHAERLGTGPLPHIYEERLRTGPLPPMRGEREQMHEQSDPASWQRYYEPTMDAQEDMDSSLEAISTPNSMETELDLGADYDVDKILREYGFEKD